VHFDVRDVLRHAWQVTWQHRALWVVSALPLAPALVYLPVLAYAFLSDDVMNEIPRFLNNPTFILLLLIVVLVTIVVSLFLQVFSKSATAFGVVQLESGRSALSFAEMIRGGQTFFWRILVTLLFASLGMAILSAIFSACLAAVGFVTFGLGSLLGQVLFLPVTLLVYAVVEQAQVAIVADNAQPMDALRGAWELVEENINSFVYLAVLLYIGVSIASGIATFPVVASLLLAVLSRFVGEFSDPAVLQVAVLCFALFLPVSVLVQAVAVLYRKSAHVIAYLRLRRSPKLQPLLVNREATL
jgi:hypothetical protein